jgi:thiamine pyrophosphate-dependent acetolactate synthase large subunit-like protein
MARITGGEVLKRVLEKEGVRYVFGVPGDQLYPFLNALYDSNIKFVTFHHEANAAHAADAWARITGELGVVVATVGPGAANLIGGVYCITGDGAFSMGIAELETAKRLGLQITFVVLNDSAWGMIKAGQTLYYEKRYIGVDFGEIRYDLIAKAMGCYGERIEDPKEIRGALERAKLSGFPAVLDIKIDREVIPPDFQTLAMIWLEGCEPPPKIIKKEELSVVK